MLFVKTYLSSLVLFSLFDFLWLGIIAKKFNTEELKNIARLKNGELDPLMPPIYLAYLVMALSMSLFVFPHLQKSLLLKNFLWGAALGFVICSLFDFTNLAIIKDYPTRFAIVDIIWGSFLYGIVAVILSQLSFLTAPK